MTVEERVRVDDERSGSLVGKMRKGGIKIALVAGRYGHDMHTEGSGCDLHLHGIRLGIWVTRVHEHGDHVGLRCQLAQYLEPLWSERVVEERRTGDVAAGTVETRYKTEFDRVVSGGENSRDRRGGHRERRRSAGRGNHADLTANQISR